MYFLFYIWYNSKLYLQIEKKRPLEEDPPLTSFIQEKKLRNEELAKSVQSPTELMARPGFKPSDLDSQT